MATKFCVFVCWGDFCTIKFVKLVHLVMAPMGLRSTSWSAAHPIPLCKCKPHLLASASISVSHSWAHTRSFIISLTNARYGFSPPDFSIPSSSATAATSKPRSRLPPKSSYYQHQPTNSNALHLQDDHGNGSSSTQQFPAPDPTVHSRTWKWRGYSIRYQCCGDGGPALVLVHGFGANSDHWRKNLPVLGKSHRVYAIDLIGYGYSDKPNPRDFSDTPFYTFETWASQLNDFCMEVVQNEAFFICNSIGGLVGLQAAVTAPHVCKGLILLNISLRMLHIKKQPLLARLLIKSFQNLLRNTTLGKLFYRTVAKPQSVKNILCQCYHDTSQVTEELVEKILLPGLEPGAADVFLEFICYSDGPLPEELLPQVKCPVLIAWGNKDPWEPIDLGRAYGNFKSVEDFVALPDVGHCPQDEAPHLVNPLVELFVARHSATGASVVSGSSE